MMKLSLIGLVVVSVFLLSSCATIIKGTTEQVSFNSEPDGANVVLLRKNKADKTVCKTPCTAEVHKKTKEVRFEKDGYYNEQYQIVPGFQFWFLGNFFIHSSSPSLFTFVTIMFP